MTYFFYLIFFTKLLKISGGFFLNLRYDLPLKHDYHISKEFFKKTHENTIWHSEIQRTENCYLEISNAFSMQHDEEHPQKNINLQIFFTWRDLKIFSFLNSGQLTWWSKSCNLTKLTTPFQNVRFVVGSKSEKWKGYKNTNLIFAHIS